MKFYITCAGIIAATVTALAQPMTIGPNVPVSGGVTYIQPTMPARTITNIVGSATAGKTLYFLRGSYWIPTNSSSWLIPGVDFYFEPGTRLAFGTTGDGTALGSRPIFTTTVATTNNIVAWGTEIVVSNQLAHIFDIQHAASRVSVVGHNLHRANTGTGGCPIRTQRGQFNFLFTGTITNNGYDGIWMDGQDNTHRVQGYAFRLESAAESAFEITAGVLPGFGQLEFGMVRAPTMNVMSNWVVKAQEIQTTSFGFDNCVTEPGTVTATKIGPMTAGGACVIIGDSTPNGGTLRINGAVINGGTGAAIQLDDTASATPPTIVLNSCELVSGGTYSVEKSVGGVGGLPKLSVIGGLRVNKPISDEILWLGGEIVGPPLTNSYAGTNVVFSLSRQSKQALVATNAMLIIWTNILSGLPSGVETEFAIYNNGATNMNIAHTTANVRYMGGVSNVVVAAKSLLIRARRDGTNAFLTFFPQVN